MNPSRIFILRPVATSLLMLALLLVGIVAYRELPISALPQVDYPTIQVVTLYPGASQEVMTTVDYRATGAPTRPVARFKPDVVFQFGWRFGNHASVQPEA